MVAGAKVGRVSSVEEPDEYDDAHDLSPRGVQGGRRSTFPSLDDFGVAESLASLQRHVA